jgi:hypothetical protein
MKNKDTNQSTDNGYNEDSKITPEDSDEKMKEKEYQQYNKQEVNKEYEQGGADKEMEKELDELKKGNIPDINEKGCNTGVFGGGEGGGLGENENEKL